MGLEDKGHKNIIFLCLCTVTVPAQSLLRHCAAPSDTSLVHPAVSLPDDLFLFFLFFSRPSFLSSTDFSPTPSSLLYAELGASPVLLVTSMSLWLCVPTSLLHFGESSDFFHLVFPSCVSTLYCTTLRSIFNEQGTAEFVFSS